MMRRYPRRVIPIALLVALFCATLMLSRPAAAEEPPSVGGGSNDTELISIGLDGNANNVSYDPRLSLNGRFVAFSSFASNLVLNDTNDAVDIFVRDMNSDTVQRVSMNTLGGEANDSSGAPMMTTNARYVTFYSFATNLAPDDTNGFTDIFMADRTEGTTALISEGIGGVPANGDSYLSDISGDGSAIVFDSVATNLVAVDDNDWSDVFWYDRASDTTTMISISNNNTPGNAASERPRISGDGTYVIFFSYADNLVTGDTNELPDLFGIDLTTFEIERINVATNGSQANAGVRREYALSSDGRFVVFASDSTNLVSGDTNGVSDIFVRDRVANTTRRLSVSFTGGQGNGNSMDPTISTEGRFVGFVTEATNLFPGDTNGVTDSVVVDRRSRVVSAVSQSVDGAPLDGASGPPYFSEDGSMVGFYSEATNLVDDDTNGYGDLFRRDFAPFVSKFIYMPIGARNYRPFPCLTAEQEPNNTSGEANANQPLCQGVILNGTLPGGDNNDYYRIVLTSPAMVRVELFNISAGSDFDLYLYNSALTQIAASSTNGNASEQIGPVQLPTGTYFIRVYPDPTEPGGGRQYQLRWSR